MKITDNRRHQPAKIPTLGSLKVKDVFEYANPDSRWLRGIFVKLNSQGHYLQEDFHKCWVLNMSTGKLGHHRINNQVVLLDAEVVINGEM